MSKSRFLFVFLFSFIFYANYFAQIDKTPEEKKVDSLLILANQAQLEVNIINVIKYSNEALTKSKSIKYSRGKTQSCLFIATGLYDLGKYKDALSYVVMGENEKFAKKVLYF